MEPSRDVSIGGAIEIQNSIVGIIVAPDILRVLLMRSDCGIHEDPVEIAVKKDTVSG